VRYWDSSAIIPLIAAEPESQALMRLHAEDPAVTTWWTTRLECLAALERRRREGAVDGDALHAARARIRTLQAEWFEVLPSEQVIEHAERLLRTHPLRTSDALQLASALAISDGRPSTLEFVTLDARMADAARQEGFQLLP
jgi:predicted nucleic acid-binding protein